MSQAFHEAYARLNHAQREAVDATEGPVMVIAGPGTGKTQILTLRIARILETTDIGPDGILALTFTEAGARAMRERLAQYIGQAAYRVTIATFHEFAGLCIKQYPTAYERVIGGRPASDLEKVRIIEEIIESHPFQTLRPHGNPAFYIKPILSAIAHMKREYITHDRLSAIIRASEEKLAQTQRIHDRGAHKGKVRSEYQKLEKSIARNQELLFVYRMYDHMLTQERLFDFEDMILETVSALEHHEDLLRDLQEHYQYILADEHQDVNGSQNRILELLASYHARPNIFVVGDEKQAIYRFQGASLENFLYFEDTFEGSKIIALTENYRSSQNILDLAHALITETPSPADELRVPLHAQSEEVGTVEYTILGHEAIEDARVIDRVREFIKDGVSPDSIAIIVRSNREVESFTMALRDAQIPVHPTADSDILHHPITAHVRSLVRALVEPEDDSALFAVLHGSYWNIPLTDFITVCKERNYTRSLVQIMNDESFLDTLPLTNKSALMRVTETLKNARTLALTEPPHRVIATLLTTCGFTDSVLATEPIESIRVLRRLYDEIESVVYTERAVTLSDVLDMFQSHIEHTIPLNAPYIHASTHAVQVLTAHKSKGLEFDYVFLPHLTDTRWGDTTKPTYFDIPLSKHVDDASYDALDDERKLLYVGITRARKGVFLSMAKENTQGRTSGETPLLSTLRNTALNPVVFDTHETDFDPLLGLKVHIQPQTLHTDMFKQLLTTRGLSATALNNYLKSPWTYVYRNLLRVPEVQSEQAQFGTVLHATLRHLTHQITAKQTSPTATDIKNYLERELMKLPLSVHEYTRFHERALQALTLYVPHMCQDLPQVTWEEYSLRAHIETGDATLPHIMLTGQLDRLDFTGDPREGGELVRVIDYKSGKPKTRGHIEGNTKDSTGDYKRQLVFYALLLSLQDDPRFHTRNMVLSFVETDEQGRIHEEPYTITDEEIDTLKSLIVRVGLEIAQGAFLNAPCDPAQCDYCHLVPYFQRNITR